MILSSTRFEVAVRCRGMSTIDAAFTQSIGVLRRDILRYEGAISDVEPFDRSPNHLGKVDAHLHDNALSPTTAPCSGLLLAHLHLCSWRAIHALRWAARRVGRHLLIVSADLSNDVVEGIIDVDA